MPSIEELKRALAKKKAMASQQADDGDGQDSEDYREQINEDFQEAPLTDAQKGEQAGTRAHNAVVDSANRAFQSSKAVINADRKQMSDKSQAEQTAKEDAAWEAKKRAAALAAKKKGK